MKDLLVQIEKGLDNNLYFLALYGVLAIPDICGAISSNNGEASPKKYKNWFNQYVSPQYHGFLDGEDCYYFRCSLLHQGSSEHPKSNYAKIIFVEPSATTNIFHCNKINGALNIDVRIFCKDIISGAKLWLSENKDTKLYKENYKKFMKRYQNGIHPYIVGIPVIG